MDPLETDDRPSKSELKRRHHAIRDLGAAMADLKPAERARLPLGDHLRSAVDEAARLRKGARQRQLRYLAKLLADEDLEPIQAVMDAIAGQGTQAAAAHHRLEDWRDRLIAQGDPVLEELVRTYPSVERGQVRSLIRQARREQRQGRPSRGARSLFRLLRELQDVELAANAQASGQTPEDAFPDAGTDDAHDGDSDESKGQELTGAAAPRPSPEEGEWLPSPGDESPAASRGGPAVSKAPPSPASPPSPPSPADE